MYQSVRKYNVLYSAQFETLPLSSFFILHNPYRCSAISISQCCLGGGARVGSTPRPAKATLAYRYRFIDIKLSKAL